MKKRHGLILSLVIVFLLGVSGYWVLPTVRAKYKLRNGKIAYNQGNYDEVLKLLGDAVRLDPRLSEAHQYYVATLFAKYGLGEGQYLYKAMDVYLELLKTKSSGTDAIGIAILNIADFVHHQGWNDEAAKIYDEALKVFEQAIQRDPKLSQVKQYYGATLYAKYHLAREEEYARKSLEAFRQIYEEEKQKSSPDKEAISNAAAYLAVIHKDLADSAKTDAEREERIQKYREWLLKYAEDSRSGNNAKAMAYYSIGVEYWKCSYDQTTRYADKARIATEPFHYRNMDNQAALPDKQKAEACVARGLENLENALRIDPGYVDAMFYKVLLYRERQKLTKEDAMRKKLEQDAVKIANEADDLQKKKEVAPQSQDPKIGRDAATPSLSPQVEGEAVTPRMVVLGLDIDAQGRATEVKINQFPVKGRRPEELLRRMLLFSSDRETVYIRASQNTVYGEVVRLFGYACEAGASSVELQLDGLPASPPLTIPPTPPPPLQGSSFSPLYLLLPPPPPPPPPPLRPLTKIGDLPTFIAPIRLPQSLCESPPSEDMPPDPLSLLVTIPKEGEGYKLNTEEHKDLNALGERLFRALDGRPYDLKRVVIAAAPDAMYGEVVKVFDVVKKAGASPISLRVGDLPVPGRIPDPTMGWSPPPPPPPPPTSTGAPGSQKKITVSGSVLQNNATNKVQPPYPPIAKAARASGAVQVQVTVSEEGRVIDAIVISGHPLLRDAAMRAARQWVFKPTEISGAPVKVQGVLTFNFTLQ